MAVAKLNINFNLRKPNCTGATPINLVIRYNNEKLVYPTGERINPRNWQDDKTKKNYQRAKNNTVTDYCELNANLDSIEAAVSNIFRKFKNDNQHKVPSLKVLKELIDLELNRKTKPASSLIPFINKFIEDSKTRKNPKTGKAIDGKTIKKYKTTLNHIQDYIKTTGEKVDFGDINLAFRDSYINFLSTKYNHAVNSIGKDINILKVFLNAATDAGVNKYTYYKSTKFTGMSEKSDSIYLNDDELQQLYKLDLTNNRTLDSVRDLFLIGCYTGLRYSDFSSLNSTHIKDGRIIIDTKKTGATVIIPLHPVVKTILTKYNGNLPRCFSNQKTNQYLKEIGEKIDEFKVVVSRKITKGGISQALQLPKFKRITTHTARRSFATNQYKAGFPPIDLMKITGHRTESAFMRYIKITPEETANRLEQFWAQKFNHVDHASDANKDMAGQAA